MRVESSLNTYSVISTPLLACDYGSLLKMLIQRCKLPGAVAVDFSNTQVVTMNRHEADFRRLMASFDFFIPDGMPLVWAMNRQGAGLKDRVYGPTFMGHALKHSPPEIRHYFLGGSVTCLDLLRQRARDLNPQIHIVGHHHGYAGESEQEKIVAEIVESRADFIWVGLGTPRQQAWIHRYKDRFAQGVLLAVGFAFDVNAGTKTDAPLFLQRHGLTWVYRMSREPRRLLPRYLKYNSLFLLYLLRQALGRLRAPGI